MIKRWGKFLGGLVAGSASTAFVLRRPDDTISPDHQATFPTQPDDQPVEKSEPVPNDSKIPEYYRFGTPICFFESQHRSFATLINFQTRLPIYSISYLTPSHLSTSIASREGVSFLPNDNVPLPFQASNSDYFRSGFSRGHLTPAGDLKHEQESMNESFLLTNIVPQDLEHNMYYWNRLERMVRDVAKAFEKTYVVTGPLFLPESIGRELKRRYVKDEDEKHPVGEESERDDSVDVKKERARPKKDCIRYDVLGGTAVAVPTHMYKIILSERTEIRDEIAKKKLYLSGFVIPNEPIPDEAPIDAFMVPVHTIEKWCGAIFFPKLKKLESVIESESVDDDHAYRIKSVCDVFPCELVNARDHRLMQMTRWIGTSRTKYWLDRNIEQIKQAGYEITEDLQHKYNTRLVELQAFEEEKVKEKNSPTLETKNSEQPSEQKVN